MEWRRGGLTSRDGFLLKCGSIDDPAINEYVVRNFGQQSLAGGSAVVVPTGAKRAL